MGENDSKKSTMKETREGCSDFERRPENEFPRYIGECQTDGHYMCAVCRHIAPFDAMVESDNKMLSYPKDWLAANEDEDETDLIDKI